MALPVVGVDTASGDFGDVGLGAFGEVTLTAGEDLDLSAGLRYDHEWKDADIQNTFVSGGVTLVDNTTTDEADYGALSPTFGVAYALTEETTLYGRVAKGYRAGGFNLTAPTSNTSYDPDETWSYELGFKGMLVEEMLGWTVAAFFIDWDDQQLSRPATWNATGSPCNQR
jgi:iron complex outermembrane receptor protein